MTSFAIAKQRAYDLEVQIGDNDAVNANPRCGKWSEFTYDDNVFGDYVAEYGINMIYKPKTLSCESGNMIGRYFFIRATQCGTDYVLALNFVRISAISTTCTACPTNTSNAFSTNMKLFSTCWCQPGFYYAPSSCVLCPSGN